MVRQAKNDYQTNSSQLEQRCKQIEHDICTMAFAGGVTISTSIARGVQQILIRPDITDRVVSAARDGKTDRAFRYFLEALRFNTMFPFLTRHVIRDTAISRADGKMVNVKAGDTVVLGMQAAMHDPRVIASPEVLRADRNMSDYLHFGHGLHQCIGGAMAQAQMEVIVTELFSFYPKPYQKNTEGVVYKSDWPSARSLVVEFRQ